MSPTSVSSFHGTSFLEYQLFELLLLYFSWVIESNVLLRFSGKPLSLSTSFDNVNQVVCILVVSRYRGSTSGVEHLLRLFDRGWRKGLDCLGVVSQVVNNKLATTTNKMLLINAGVRRFYA